METKILKPTKKNIKTCADALLNGQLIGMPTETVYGLGANAFNEEAVRNIFIAKNRPQDNPLIVHVHKDYDLTKIVSEITPLAKKLLDAFTPGPITLVMKSNGTVCPAVSRGLSTVAVRIPSHKIAQEFLKQCDVPVAAPSANLSSRMSGTDAKAVKEELGGKLPYILDGGQCSVGIESTVVDVTQDEPIILRPGKITKEELMQYANNVQEKTTYKKGEKVFSPGVKYKHYSPKIPVFVCPYENYDLALDVYDDMVKKGFKPVVLCQFKEKQFFKGCNVKLFGLSVNSVAKTLYLRLRQCEKKYSSIIICSVENSGFGVAVMNRMSKMNSYNYSPKKEKIKNNSTE